MKFLADENILESVIQYLREKGHEVLSIRESGLSGSSDEEIFQIAIQKNLVVLTMDKDFLRMFRFPPNKCGGIIVTKIYQRSFQETRNIFSKYFEPLSEHRIRGNLVIITPEGVRIRSM